MGGNDSVDGRLLDAPFSPVRTRQVLGVVAESARDIQHIGRSSMELRWRTALVTGASKNIGAHVVCELKKKGCTVSGISRTTSKADHHLNIDLEKPGATQEAINWVAETVGHPDIIVHALGGSNGHTDTWGSSDEWEKVWRLNIGIAHDINAAFIKEMIRKQWGRIVHFSSVATTAHIGYCPYASAKHAVEGYVHNVAREVAKYGVIISAIRPGAFPYPGRFLYELDERHKKEFIEHYIPIGRFGEAQEAARVVKFLCSDQASYMAGSIVAVDGGHR